MALEQRSHFPFGIILHPLERVKLHVAAVAPSQRYGREFNDAEVSVGHGT
jgi:hypothetical protein